MKSSELLFENVLTEKKWEQQDERKKQKRESTKVKWWPEWLLAIIVKYLKVFKVHVFWEGHKNWQNLHRQFDSM